MKTMPVDRKKLIFTGLLLVMLTCTAISGFSDLTFNNAVFKSIDSKAEEYVNEGMVRAGSAYFIARTINAVVSVIEGTELHLEPAGVGVSLAVGEALDPLNDMVERFSWVMLLSLTSLGIQKVLIQIGPWLSMNIILPLGLLALLAHLWSGLKFKSGLRRIGGSLVLVAILIRFAVPIMAGLNESVYQAVLHDRYEESTDFLNKKGQKLASLQLVDSIQEHTQPPKVAQEEEDEGWISKKWNATGALINQAVEAGKGVMDFNQRLQEIKEIVAELFDKFVDLVIIFIICTVVLPIFFLWLLLRLGSLLIGTAFGQGFEDFFKGKILHPNQRERKVPVSEATTPKCEKCGANLVKRKATTGTCKGEWFLVCDRYPTCKYTRPL